MITVNAMGAIIARSRLLKQRKQCRRLPVLRRLKFWSDELRDCRTGMLTKMAASSGGKVTSEKLGEKEYKVTIAMEAARLRQRLLKKEEKPVCRIKEIIRW